ncbi:ras GTPase-activating protein 1 [Turdus rufiventris]|nr:ras GTPase-activating protein 1 [Turdus rufiventris]
MPRPRGGRAELHGVGASLPGLLPPSTGLEHACRDSSPPPRDWDMPARTPPLLHGTGTCLPGLRPASTWQPWPCRLPLRLAALTSGIAEIIEHYRKEQIVEGYYLKDPVPMQHQEQVFNDTVDGKEIYNTIRRKTKDAFYKNIVKKGYLLKKSKGKRWKNLYFILEGNDAQLIYFESEKRATKPKGLIDLSVCSVYGVHDSLFGRPNCFQIVVQHFSEEHYIFYFAGETQEQVQDWMKALQMFCSLRKNSPGTSNKRLRQVSSLILHVEEAHTLPVKHFTNPYCNIYLNSVQVAKTHIREGQNPVWSEEFVFDRLQKGHATDEWFQLSSHIPLKGIEPGSLRVRARYSMEKIMPEEEYSEFKELILQKEMHVVYALSHVCGQDRTLLAGILLKIFLHEKLESLLLRTLNDREINMEVPYGLQKSGRGWGLTVDYHGLNEIMPWFSAAILDMEELQYELESKWLVCG